MGRRRVTGALAAMLALIAVASGCTTPPPPATPAVATSAVTLAATSSATATARAAATSGPAANPGVANEIERANPSRHEIAMTFDCGGHAGPTAEILRVLREANVSATFFMIGDWVRAYPDLAREIAARHEFASHSDTHPDYRDLTDAQIVADLEAAERTFVAITGKTTRPLWRAPSAARDNRVLAAAASAGWTQHAFWTIGSDEQGPLTGDSGDWRPFTAAQVEQNLLRAPNLGNGVITVSHCDSEQTREVLPRVLRAWAAAGWRVTTLSDAMRGG